MWVASFIILIANVLKLLIIFLLLNDSGAPSFCELPIFDNHILGLSCDLVLFLGLVYADLILLIETEELVLLNLFGILVLSRFEFLFTLVVIIAILLNKTYSFAILDVHVQNARIFVLIALIFFLDLHNGVVLNKGFFVQSSPSIDGL